MQVGCYTYYMTHTSVNLYDRHEKWLKSNHINLSSMVREFIDNKINETESQKHE